MKKVLAIILCLLLCIASIVAVFAALKTVDSGKKDETVLSQLAHLPSASPDNTALTVDDQTFDTTAPTYFVNFADSEVEDNFAHEMNLEHTFGEGYITFKATAQDPYVYLDGNKPTAKSGDMKYTLFVYRLDAEDLKGEIYVALNGISMGQPGSNTQFSWEKSTDWAVKIVDTSTLTNGNEVYSAYRIDPIANDEVQYAGKSIDIKCLATFATEEDAKAFNLDEYLKYLKAEEEKKDTPSDDDKPVGEWSDIQFVDKTPDIYDSFDGTVKYTYSEDKSTVTISYELNGETVSYTVPNNANYVSGGFAGTDDLDRTLPNAYTTGIYGSNGEYYVGLFYFLWLGEHGDYGVFDNTKIIQQYEDAATNTGRWGPVGAMHFFSEPLYGYYYSRDEWVVRKHMELLSNANVDFLYFDVTNGYSYLSNAKRVMEVLHQMNEEGYDAPQVVFYTHSAEKSVVEQLYNQIYSKNLYPDTWFYVDGKPAIVCSQSSNIDNFFTTRTPQWPNEPDNTTTSWPWMDFKWPQRIFQDFETGKGGAISVSIAQHSGSVRFSSSALYGDKTNRGRTTDTKDENRRNSRPVTADSYKYGYNFQAQWNRVFAVKDQIKYVLVTGWNEWVAQRQPSLSSTEHIVFVDTITLEYSRDAEMTRGGYFDNYYMQLISNIQTLKGSAPVIVQDARNPINVTGDFSQWNDVIVKYYDPSGDAADRDSKCFNNGTYTDQSGNNDIIEAKVTSDTKNVYFYVKTVAPISIPTGNSSWMQLFVNVDRDAKTGWYGYDYIINYTADKDTFKSTVAKCNTTDGSYGFEVVGTVDFQVKGNEMMVEVPMEMIGIEGYLEVDLEFKWADADSNVVFDEMEDFYCFGDVAPLGRLNWIYQNYIPEVSNVTYPDDEDTTVDETESETESDTDEDTTVEESSAEDTTVEETSAEVTTTEESSDEQSNADASQKTGCKSSVIASVVAIVAMAGCGVAVVSKKKF